MSFCLFQTCLELSIVIISLSWSLKSFSAFTQIYPSCSTRRDMTLNLPTDPNFFEQLFNVLDPVRIPKNAPRKNHEYSRVRYLNWLNIFERKCLKLFLFLTSFVGNLKLLSNAWLIFSIQRLLQQIFGKNRSL